MFCCAFFIGIFFNIVLKRTVDIYGCVSSAARSIVSVGKAPPSVWFPFPFDVESINFFLSLHCDLERRYSVSNSTSDCVTIS